MNIHLIIFVAAQFLGIILNILLSLNICIFSFKYIRIRRKYIQLNTLLYTCVAKIILCIFYRIQEFS